MENYQNYEYKGIKLFNHFELNDNVLEYMVDNFGYQWQDHDIAMKFYKTIATKLRTEADYDMFFWHERLLNLNYTMYK